VTRRIAMGPHKRRRCMTSCAPVFATTDLSVDKLEVRLRFGDTKERKCVPPEKRLTTRCVHRSSA